MTLGLSGYSDGGQTMDNHKGVLVCGEIADGKLAPVTIELIGLGRKLADELGEQ